MAFGIRYIIKRIPRSCIIRSRGIAMTTPALQKAMEMLEKNPYYDKYAERIAKLQSTSPEEFLQRAQSMFSASAGGSTAKANESAPCATGTVDTRHYSSVLNPKRKLGSESPLEDKKLEDIFKIDLVKDKEASEIQLIWEEYHKHKEVISATIPFDLYTSLQERMKSFPTFLFPLPRVQGYEFILSQCFGHSIHFTPLLAYQVHKENAPECLTMVHYTELNGKNIVLMRGEYDKNVLNGQEAQCLANQFQMYYSGRDEAKLCLLQSFTAHPDSFKHMDLIAQLENITLV